jgi:alpha-1,2-mannosyltransferase
VPLALALWDRSRVVSIGWVAVFVARPFVWPPHAEGREYGWSWAEHLVGNAYLIAAIAVVCWSARQAASATVPGITVGGQSHASSHGR